MSFLLNPNLSSHQLGRPSFCGADLLATDSLCRDPEASVVAFRYGEIRHVFAVRQRLRPDAATAVAALVQAGIVVEILSGDREPAVRHAAQSLGIQEWRAGVTPADKIARIEELKDDPQVRVGLREGQGGAEAHDAAADDRQVRGLRHGRQNTITLSPRSTPASG